MKILWGLIAIALVGCGGGESSPSASTAAATTASDPAPDPAPAPTPPPQSAPPVVVPAPQAPIAQAPAPTASPPDPAPDPPSPPSANALEGVYTYVGATPALIVDASGNFWLNEKLTCAWYASGVWADGVALKAQDDGASESCNSASEIGPTSGSLALAASLDSGLLTLHSSWTDSARDPNNPRLYDPEPLSATLALPLMAPSSASMSAIVGTWPLIGPSSFTIAEDGSFTLEGCAWQVSISDTAVNVYTITGSCGVGVMTLWQRQLIGGLTIAGKLVNLSVVPANQSLVPD